MYSPVATVAVVPPESPAAWVPVAEPVVAATVRVM